MTAIKSSIFNIVPGQYRPYQEHIQRLLAPQGWEKITTASPQINPQRMTAQAMSITEPLVFRKKQSQIACWVYGVSRAKQSSSGAESNTKIGYGKLELYLPAIISPEILNFATKDVPSVVKEINQPTEYGVSSQRVEAKPAIWIIAQKNSVPYGGWRTIRLPADWKRDSGQRTGHKIDHAIEMRLQKTINEQYVLPKHAETKEFVEYYKDNQEFNLTVEELDQQANGQMSAQMVAAARIEPGNEPIFLSIEAQTNAITPMQTLEDLIAQIYQDITEQAAPKKQKVSQIAVIFDHDSFMKQKPALSSKACANFIHGVEQIEIFNGKEVQIYPIGPKDRPIAEYKLGPYLADPQKIKENQEKIKEVLNNLVNLSQKWEISCKRPGLIHKIAEYPQLATIYFCLGAQSSLIYQNPYANDPLAENVLPGENI